MRGSSLAITIGSLVFCGVILAQKVQFAPVEKSSILQRMKSIPPSDAERAMGIKEMFSEAGCVGNSLIEQKIDGAETPNIICRLGTGEGDTLIVGAHYDRVSSPQRPVSQTVTIVNCSDECLGYPSPPAEKTA